MPHPLTERATSAASGITSGHQRTDGDHSISPTSRDPVAPVAAQNTAAKDRVMTAPAETFDDFNPWSDGMRRRQTLRGGELQQNGAQQNGADQASKAEAKDPYAFVPSASSGKPANVGRGGFPTPQILLGRIFNLLFPAFKSRFVKTISRHDGDEALHTPQTFREVKKAIHGVFSEYADSKEDRVSLRVKWLPSEIRCIVVGRNSKFFEEELDEYDLEILGSLEYRATKFFTILLIVVSPTDPPTSSITWFGSLKLGRSTNCFGCSYLQLSSPSTSPRFIRTIRPFNPMAAPKRVRYTRRGSHSSRSSVSQISSCSSSTTLMLSLQPATVAAVSRELPRAGWLDSL